MAGHAGHIGLDLLKVMSAVETCRMAALGGHVEGCADCGHARIADNSCRNRHGPKCQGAAAREWLAARRADLLPVGTFHVVFTVPAVVADIAFNNTAAVYDLLFPAASQTMLTIAADPRHLGARIGLTAVLQTWGSALTHHPHLHMIVPGGGLLLDGRRWVASRPAFLLSVRVLGALFRRLFLAGLIKLHDAGRPRFFGEGPASPTAAPSPPRPRAEDALGGLRQAAVRRAKGRARRPQPLHASGRDLEGPPARA